MRWARSVIRGTRVRTHHAGARWQCAAHRPCVHMCIDLPLNFVEGTIENIHHQHLPQDQRGMVELEDIPASEILHLVEEEYRKLSVTQETASRAPDWKRKRGCFHTSDCSCTWNNVACSIVWIFTTYQQNIPRVDYHHRHRWSSYCLRLCQVVWLSVLAHVCACKSNVEYNTSVTWLWNNLLPDSTDHRVSIWFEVSNMY